MNPSDISKPIPDNDSTPKKEDESTKKVKKHNKSRFKSRKEKKKIIKSLKKTSLLTKRSTKLPGHFGVGPKPISGAMRTPGSIPIGAKSPFASSLSGPTSINQPPRSPANSVFGGPTAQSTVRIPGSLPDHQASLNIPGSGSGRLMGPAQQWLSGVPVSSIGQQGSANGGGSNMSIRSELSQFGRDITAIQQQLIQTLTNKQKEQKQHMEKQVRIQQQQKRQNQFQKESNLKPSELDLKFQSFLNKIDPTNKLDDLERYHFYRSFLEKIQKRSLRDMFLDAYTDMTMASLITKIEIPEPKISVVKNSSGAEFIQLDPNGNPWVMVMKGTGSYDGIIRVFENFIDQYENWLKDHANDKNKATVEQAMRSAQNCINILTSSKDEAANITEINNKVEEASAQNHYFKVMKLLKEDDGDKLARKYCDDELDRNMKEQERVQQSQSPEKNQILDILRSKYEELEMLKDNIPKLQEKVLHEEKQGFIGSAWQFIKNILSGGKYKQLGAGSTLNAVKNPVLDSLLKERSQTDLLETLQNFDPQEQAEGTKIYKAALAWMDKLYSASRDDVTLNQWKEFLAEGNYILQLMNGNRRLVEGLIKDKSRKQVQRNYYDDLFEHLAELARGCAQSLVSQFKDDHAVEINEMMSSSESSTDTIIKKLKDELDTIRQTCILAYRSPATEDIKETFNEAINDLIFPQNIEEKTTNMFTQQQLQRVWDRRETQDTWFPQRLGRSIKNYFTNFWTDYNQAFQDYVYALYRFYKTSANPITAIQSNERMVNLINLLNGKEPYKQFRATADLLVQLTSDPKVTMNSINQQTAIFAKNKDCYISLMKELVIPRLFDIFKPYHFICDCVNMEWYHNNDIDYYVIESYLQMKEAGSYEAVITELKATYVDQFHIYSNIDYSNLGDMSTFTDTLLRNYLMIITYCVNEEKVDKLDERYSIFRHDKDRQASNRQRELILTFMDENASYEDWTKLYDDFRNHEKNEDRIELYSHFNALMAVNREEREALKDTTTSTTASPPVKPAQPPALPAPPAPPAPTPPASPVPSAPAEPTKPAPPASPGPPSGPPPAPTTASQLEKATQEFNKVLEKSPKKDLYKSLLNPAAPPAPADEKGLYAAKRYFTQDDLKSITEQFNKRAPYITIQDKSTNPPTTVNLALQDSRQPDLYYSSDLSLGILSRLKGQNIIPKGIKIFYGKMTQPPGMNDKEYVATQMLSRCPSIFNNGGPNRQKLPVDYDRKNDVYVTDNEEVQKIANFYKVPFMTFADHSKMIKQQQEQEEQQEQAAPPEVKPESEPNEQAAEPEPQVNEKEFLEAEPEAKPESEPNKPAAEPEAKPDDILEQMKRHDPVIYDKDNGNEQLTVFYDPKANTYVSDSYKVHQRARRAGVKVIHNGEKECWQLPSMKLYDIGYGMKPFTEIELKEVKEIINENRRLDVDGQYVYQTQDLRWLKAYKDGLLGDDVIVEPQYTVRPVYGSPDQSQLDYLGAQFAIYLPKIWSHSTDNVPIAVKKEKNIYVCDPSDYELLSKVTLPHGVQVMTNDQLQKAKAESKPSEPEADPKPYIPSYNSLGLRRLDGNEWNSVFDQFQRKEPQIKDFLGDVIAWQDPNQNNVYHTNDIYLFHLKDDLPPEIQLVPKPFSKQKITTDEKYIGAQMMAHSPIIYDRNTDQELPDITYDPKHHLYVSNNPMIRNLGIQYKVNVMTQAQYEQFLKQQSEQQQPEPEDNDHIANQMFGRTPYINGNLSNPVDYDSKNDVYITDDPNVQNIAKYHGVPVMSNDEYESWLNSKQSVPEPDQVPESMPEPILEPEPQNDQNEPDLVVDPEPEQPTTAGMYSNNPRNRMYLWSQTPRRFFNQRRSVNLWA